MDINNLYKIFLDSKGVNTDSRSIKKGEIFFALKGESFNGNQYAEKAIAAGALAAIIDDENFKKGKNYILVEDCLDTLQELAHLHRKKLNIPVIAITGSNGKTTTKELLASVLSKKLSIHFTRGNLNNHIGVPLSLLQMKKIDLAIIEMGANHSGEIAKLCQIADPDYGLITNIGKAHLEGFGSLEGVLRAKTELYQYLARKDGIVFINGTNQALTGIATDLELKQYSYYKGENLICDGFLYPNSFFLNAEISFIEGKQWPLSTQITGNYNLENILAAACVGKYFNVDEKDIIDSLEQYKPENNRSQLIETGRNRIILDAYNANPTSMSEALENFNNLKAGNKMVILGEMAELGKYSESEHQDILKLLQNYNFDSVLLGGKEFFKHRKNYSYSFFKNTLNLYEHLQKNSVSDHSILLKSSRTGKFETLVDLL